MSSEVTLADAILLAAKTVGQVREKRNTLPVALEKNCFGIAATLRGAVQDLSYLSMRQMAAAEAIVRILVAQRPHGTLYNLLIVALALLLDKQTVRYPEFTVVNQAVAALERTRLRSGKGLINAVLRNFLRQRAELTQTLIQTASTRWNYPLWWIARVRSDYPEQWEHLLDAGNHPPPLTLRINRAHCHPVQALAILAKAKISAQQIGAIAIKLDRPMPVQQITGFTEGLCSVQDAGAQLAVPLLDLHHGMRVLDACAAPGGKTGHLLETAELHITALDSDEQRARRITENTQRIRTYPGATVQVLVGDARHPNEWWDGHLFDRILVDAPCSASGIVRRHPDIRWLRKPADIQKLVKQQRSILKALWPLLAPQGKLLYATCSIFFEEGEGQAHWFERNQTDAVRLPTIGQLLPGEQTDNKPNNMVPHDCDGFFYALFEKQLN